MTAECYKTKPVKVRFIFPTDDGQAFIAVDDVTEAQLLTTDKEKGWIGVKGHIRGEEDGKMSAVVVKSKAYQALRRDFYEQIFTKGIANVKCSLEDIKILGG
ncbi:hypothetical protein [Acidaminococcus intestini]|uniref:hypothetical protein n=1 Tax=Acidaminococcus intestini TaxID=187327 RepID=UPI003AB41A8F